MGANVLQQLYNAVDTVACRLEIYMLVPGGAFTQAMAVYAGQNYGAERVDRIRKGLGQAVLMAEITALSVAGIVLLFTRQFVGLYALEESAAAFCVRRLHAVCLGIVINAAQKEGGNMMRKRWYMVAFIWVACLLLA